MQFSRPLAYGVRILSKAGATAATYGSTMGLTWNVSPVFSLFFFPWDVKSLFSPGPAEALFPFPFSTRTKSEPSSVTGFEIFSSRRNSFRGSFFFALAPTVLPPLSLFLTSTNFLFFFGDELLLFTSSWLDFFTHSFLGDCFLTLAPTSPSLFPCFTSTNFRFVFGDRLFPFAAEWSNFFSTDFFPGVVTVLPVRLLPETSESLLCSSFAFAGEFEAEEICIGLKVSRVTTHFFVGVMCPFTTSRLKPFFISTFGLSDDVTALTAVRSVSFSLLNTWKLSVFWFGSSFFCFVFTSDPSFCKDFLFFVVPTDSWWLGVLGEWRCKCKDDHT